MVMNPSLPGDCGYQCLKIVGYVQTCDNVRWLRRIVAEGVVRARLEDTCVAGVRVHVLIAKKCLTLKAYHREVSTRVWACTVELAIGTARLGIVSCICTRTRQRSLRKVT